MKQHGREIWVPTESIGVARPNSTQFRNRLAVSADHDDFAFAFDRREQCRQPSLGHVSIHLQHELSLV